MDLFRAVKYLITGMNANSIRDRLSFFYLSLAIGPLLLLGMVLFLESYSVQKQQAIELLGEVSERAAIETEHYVRTLENELHVMISTNNIMNLDRSAQTRIMRRTRSYENGYHKDVFNELILLDTNGKERTRVSRTKIYTKDDLGDRSFAEEFLVPVKTGKIYYGPVIRDNFSGEPFITMGMPLMDARTGSANGVLVAELRLKDAWILIENMHIGESGCVYLLDEKGTVVAHRDPSIALKGVRFPLPEHAGVQRGLAGNKVILAFRTIRLGDRMLHVVTEKPLSQALYLSIRIMSVIGIFFVMALASAITLGVLVRRRIVYPIEALAGTARAISDGDLSKRAGPFTNNELGTLAKAFNAMTEKLARTIDSLKQSIADRDAANRELAEQSEWLQRVNKNLSLEIAERIKAEKLLTEAVRKSEDEKAKTEGIIAAIGDGIVILDTDFKVLYQNAVHKKMIGDHVGEFCYKAFERQEETCEACPVKLSFADGLVRTVERTAPTDRGVRQFEITVSPLSDSTGKLTGCVEVTREITNRKKSELALMESEAWKSAMVKAFDGFLYVCSPDYRIEFMNAPLIERTGYDATGELCYKAMHGLDSICPWCANQRVLKGETVRWEMQSPKDNRWYYVVDNPVFHPGGAISKQAMIMDITDRKLAEKELLNAKKLESIAMLAAGIAHEINNPLTNASLNIQILKKRLTGIISGSDILKKVESIEKNLGRASTIARDLLEFSRQRHFDFKPLNVSELIAGVLALLKHRLGKIKLRQNLSKTNMVCGDFLRLEQVFINIINNAVDAMPDGGDLFIESAATGNGVEVIVSDTGVGIPECDLPRIFDPFFTTKDVGSGTGLGLSICYGIIRHHQGAIDISSKAGKGTTVAVRLPFTSTHE